MTSVILIICDELNSLENLTPEFVESLEGINKFKKRCLNFKNFYNGSQPCSAARSVIYTGQQINETHVTDNMEVTWQKTMVTPKDGLKTFGSYYENNRYIGKCHFSKNLVPDDYVRYIPRLATEEYIKIYDFNKYNKMSDYCYDSRLGFLNDDFVMEQKLPSASINADYTDPITNVSYDGIIPFLKSNPENFFVCVNFDQVHDIKYTNIDTDIEDLSGLTAQFGGSDNFENTVGLYNLNYRLYSEYPVLNEQTILTNNVEDLNFELGIASQLYLKYVLYGLYPKNIEQYRQYQTGYYRHIKMFDDRLNTLYDYLELNGYFEKAIIVLTADHGDYMGAHGLVQKNAIIYKEATNIPLFFSYPEMKTEYIGYTTDIITSHVNLYTTILYLSTGCCPKKSYLPFFDECGNLYDADYHTIRLVLSVTYGPFLVPTLKSLQIPEIQEKLRNMTYLTIKGFSVASTLLINNQKYNGGYYFSLLQVFTETLKLIKDYNIIDKFVDDGKYYILSNQNESSEIAIIGKKKDIYLQYYTDSFIKLYFNLPEIKIFDKTLSLYKYYIRDDSVYDTIIVSKFKIERYQFMRNSKLCTDIYTLIVSNTFALSGTYSVISEIYYNKFYEIYADNVKFIKGLSNKHPIYICDDPIFKNVEIWSKNITLNLNLKTLLIGIINLPSIKIYNLIKQNENELLSEFVIYILKYFENTLLLPGRNKTISQLLEEEYQVQIFKDESESVNIALNKETIDESNKFLVKLNENICYNNLETIFISLPSSMIFDDEDFKQVKKIY